MKARPDNNLILGSALSVVAYVLLAYFTPRTHYWQLLLLFGLAFAGYALLLQTKMSLVQGLGLALGFRLIFFAAMPQLSDDYYRFIWDGSLVAAGENPYLHLPLTLINNQAQAIPGISPDLFLRLNSPGYYSVYPPVCQAVFGFAALLGKSSPLLAVVVMRLVLLGAEAGTLVLLVRLLKSWKKPVEQAGLYAFNPLVIVELTGNLHFEALMAFFLMASLYLIWQGRLHLSAIALGLSIGVKLLPLMFLPFILAYLGWRRFLWYGSVTALVVAALFFPFLSLDLVRHFFSSLNLYFQKFEFNASIYYLFRWLGFRLAGYNLISLIGPLLSLATILFICFRALHQPKDLRRLPENFLLALSVYLFLAPVVHPWYVTTAVVLACLGRWRYPLVWSALAVFSYAAYQTAAYQENLWLVALEYLLVFATLMLEWNRQRKDLPAANPVV
jgi:hypothetical protein